MQLHVAANFVIFHHPGELPIAERKAQGQSVKFVLLADSQFGILVYDEDLWKF